MMTRLHIQTAAWLLLALSLFTVSAAQAADDYGKPEDPVAAEALGVKIRTSNPGEMAYAIRVVLLKNYVEQNKLTATDAEIAGFLEAKQAADARGRKQAEARLAEIKTALQSPDLPEENRKQLEEEQRFLNEMLKRAVEANGMAEDPQRAMAEKNMARGVVEQWKVSQALYNKHGGRVIMMQGGPEPLDAYHAFFKEQQQAGNFKILNEAFAPALWDRFTHTDKYRFVPDDAAAKVMATPWWLQPAP